MIQKETKCPRNITLIHYSWGDIEWQSCEVGADKSCPEERMTLYPYRQSTPFTELYDSIQPLCGHISTASLMFEA